MKTLFHTFAAFTIIAVSTTVAHAQGQESKECAELAAAEGKYLSLTVSYEAIQQENLALQAKLKELSDKLERRERQIRRLKNK